MLIPFFLKNKKGNLPIVLLVFLIFLLIVSSLYLFGTRLNSIIIGISDSGIVNSANSKKNLMEFYLIKASEISMIESYKSLVSDGKYVQNPSLDLERNVRFGELSEKLNEELKEEFRINLIKNFDNYAFEENFLNKLKEIIKQDKFNVVFHENNVQIEIDDENLKIEIESNKIKLIFIPKISLDMNLNRFGLNSFQQIYSAKEKCKIQEEDNMKNCFEKELENFNIGIEKKIISSNEERFIVNLESKRSYFVDGNLESIKLNFFMI